MPALFVNAMKKLARALDPRPAVAAKHAAFARGVFALALPRWKFSWHGFVKAFAMAAFMAFPNRLRDFHKDVYTSIVVRMTWPVTRLHVVDALRV